MNVLVTGGSSGLGKDIAKAFRDEGYNVYYTYCNTESSDINAFKCDLSSEKDINELVNKLPNIDILINNASIELSNDFESKSKDDFMKTYEVNVVGNFLLSRLLGKKMFNNRFGKIINISSNNSINMYGSETIEYDISKCGINMLTKVLAKEYSPYVLVNAIAPGWIKTDRILKLDNELNNVFIEEESKNIYVNRFAETKDITDLLLFLASDKCNYINGEVIKIDGGTDL